MRFCGIITGILCTSTRQRRFPGFPLPGLDIGASGQKVTQIQEQLNAIAQVYTAIPMEPVTGYYDESTKETVRAFQRIFGLPQTGIVDYVTWYKIQEIYVGVTRIAELT